MDTLAENNDGQDNGSAASPAISLGVMLREARERLGLSVADVADQIKLAPRQIEALEADDLQHLPEMTYVRGFVRSYARILHLDAQTLLDALPQVNAVPAQLVPNSIGMPFHEGHSTQQQNKIWLGAALLLAVLVVIFAVWNFSTPIEKPDTARLETQVSLPAEMQITPASSVSEAGAVSSVPAAAVVAAAVQVSAKIQPSPAPAPAAKASVSLDLPKTQPAEPAIQPGMPPKNTALHLMFDEESWVEIKDKDGNILVSRINPIGSELRLDGARPLSLVIGHAAGVRVYYLEKQVDIKPYTNVDVARLTLE